jgi:hypothetical protein
MIYVKSFLTGLGALIVVALLAVVILVVKVWMSSAGGFFGVGAIAGPGWPVLTVSVLVFAAGFVWQYRRLSHKA